MKTQNILDINDADFCHLLSYISDYDRAMMTYDEKSSDFIIDPNTWYSTPDVYAIREDDGLKGLLSFRRLMTNLIFHFG